MRLIDITAFKSENSFVVSFKDNGIGIKSNLQKKIFDPFYRTKDTWVGLGLSVAQTILSKHMATLHVISEVGKGSTFQIVFSNYSQVR